MTSSASVLSVRRGGISGAGRPKTVLALLLGSSMLLSACSDRYAGTTGQTGGPNTGSGQTSGSVSVPQPQPQPQPPVAQKPVEPAKKPADSLSLSPADFGSLPGWERDLQGFALASFLRSCEKLIVQPDDRKIGGQNIPSTIGDWKPVCQQAAQISTKDQASARAFFETRFRPLLVSNHGEAEGLFTGYYEAELRGSRRRTSEYNVPLYSRPSDLIDVDLGLFQSSLSGQRVTGRVNGRNFIPYYKRGEIDGGALAGRGDELLWVDDPVEALFLHIQGSGRVILQDGRVVRVGFDGKNGYPYSSVGKELVRRGEMPLSEASMQGIKAWAKKNPDKVREILAHNESYVFFKIRDDAKGGPIGAQGVPLTPGRSLAVDREFLPLGVPLWLDLPYKDAPGGRIRQLVIAQDTGGAIKGPVRGDFFWGYGEQAGQYAGRMKSQGRYFLLMPRAVVSRMFPGS